MKFEIELRRRTRTAIDNSILTRGPTKAPMLVASTDFDEREV